MLLCVHVNMKSTLMVKKNRGCVKYISIGTDYRASINRDSIFFKKTYSLRTESERYNSRWKNLNTEQAYVRNINSVTNLNTIWTHLPFNRYFSCNKI